MKISKYMLLLCVITTVSSQAQDSTLLLKKLDSLPTVNFPYHAEFHNRHFPRIDLSIFSNKKLTKIPFKKISTVIGGGGIDEREDSTFNLVNENYEAEWNLIAKRHDFFVVEVHDNGVFLVSISYHLEPIDAIRIAMADPGGNRHWYADRSSVISKELGITIHHIYIMNAGPEENYKVEEKDTSKEKWMMDNTGHFKKLSIR